MPPERPEFYDHQVGITNAQESNPEAVIAAMTRKMNALFALQRYEEAVCIAFRITAMSREELRQTFCRHGVLVKHLDHEVFGIYCGTLEPSYDVHVEGATPAVLMAAKEFGRRHAQEMVLIARKLHENEHDVSQRLGLSVALNEEIPINVAVGIADLVRACGFQGATFSLQKGAIAIYHTDNLRLSPREFRKNVMSLIDELRKLYKQLQYDMGKYIISMPKL